jgi:glycosyltransferase involved in cell wall biosynthesis
MKRILFVNPTASLGGGPAVANLLASHLKGRFEVLEFFPTHGPVSEKARESGIASFFSNSKGIIRIVFSLKKIIDDENIDIVHAHGTHAALWIKLAFLIGAKHKPFIYTLHGIHFIRKNCVYRGIFLIFERITNCMVSALVAVSDTDYLSASRYKLIGEKRLFLIHNGIDYEQFSRGRDDGKLRDEWNARGKILILTVCRLVFPKDVATIIRAVHMLPKSFKLVVVGSGPDLAKLKDIDSKLGGGSVFLGDRNDIPGILAASDVFVLSSKWEGMPVTILEAMVASKPVVASDSPGITDIVKDKETGLLFAYGDAEDLKNKLGLLSNNVELYRKLAGAGNEIVRENFSASRMADAYVNIYQEYS